jgi:hypothetical protein
MLRRIEHVIGAIAVGGALLFSVALFVWRVVFDDAPWTFPRLPRMDQFGAFEIYSWILPSCSVAVVAILVVAAIRRRGRWIAPALAVVISMATAVFYLPFWFLHARRVDRLLGEIEEPVQRFRVLVTMVMLTLALVVLFVVLTRLRRMPEVVRHAALVTALMVNAGLLPLIWVPTILPFVNGWLPDDWHRPDLLVPVRPCRGALLWASGDRTLRFGAVDDIWLRFADPRKGGALTRAISVSGEWRSDYSWLDANDLRALRVRVDDPAVIDCDSRVRPERVAPASWHELGVEW